MADQVLVQILKNWQIPDLMRQSPSSAGKWGNVTFTMEKIEECDLVVVLNKVPENTIVKTNRHNLWLIIQEPYNKIHHEWILDGHDDFGKVFTHTPPPKQAKNSKYHLSQGVLPWHVDKSYDELSSMNSPPEKNKLISSITSRKIKTPGHKKRLRFLKYLMQHNTHIGCDIFGRGIREISDKWEGLAPYKYSIAIENTSIDHYWTEKITDCFLAWTIPVYCGCPNLDAYFPKGSFIRIDIDNPESALREIKKIISDKEDWKKRLPLLAEARNLILNKYQFFPFVCSQIESYFHANAESQNIQLFFHENRPAMLHRLRAKIEGKIYPYLYRIKPN